MSLDDRQKAAVRLMVLCGMRPASAIAAVRAAAAAGQALPTDAEIDEDAHEDVTDQAAAHLAWIADPAIPAEYKLILEARNAEN
jgi:hypothetical protein